MAGCLKMGCLGRESGHMKRENDDSPLDPGGSLFLDSPKWGCQKIWWVTGAKTRSTSLFRRPGHFFVLPVGNPEITSLSSRNKWISPTGDYPDLHVGSPGSLGLHGSMATTGPLNWSTGRWEKGKTMKDLQGFLGFPSKKQDNQHKKYIWLILRYLFLTKHQCYHVVLLSAHGLLSSLFTHFWC